MKKSFIGYWDNDVVNLECCNRIYKENVSIDNRKYYKIIFEFDTDFSAWFFEKEGERNIVYNRIFKECVTNLTYPLLKEGE